jgi:anti-sigma regulatory factor (Ser/Thr protein kinase)/putative methionine-R-sulfoxide reductase with GAF domain
MTPQPSNHEEGAGESATADAAATRLEDVHRVTEAALAYLDLDELLDELLQRVTEILGVDTAAVLLVEDDGRTLAARAAAGLEEEVERGFRLPIGHGFAGRVAFRREAVVIEDLEKTPNAVVNPLMHEKGVRSVLGVPLVVEGSVTGVLHVGSLTPREFQGSDAELLQLVADRVALAVERSRLAFQGQIAQALQRNLLPRTLPHLAGLSMSARYLPAAEESALGGDWYDVIELGHRQLGLTIGDVAGHGMAAATYMGHLRSAVRAYALDAESPADLLSKLSRFADQENSRMATVIYAVLNLDTWVVDFARAGHPYPLLLRGDGTATYLTDAGGPPLGAGAVADYDEQSVGLGSGETLLFYTDGLIERRGKQLSDGEAALIEAALEAPDDPELKCRTIIERLTQGIETRDDIAVLAIKSVGLHELLDVDVPATAEQLATIRHLIRRWVTANGGTDDDCSAFAIAVTEACANSVEHAYGLNDASIQVAAALVDGVATVTIRDRGAWRKPRGENRGRGIPLMREFMDDVAIDAGEDGTTVQLRRRIGAQP